MSRNNELESKLLEEIKLRKKQLEELKKAEELEKLDSVIEKAQVESKELKRIEEKRIANVERTERLVEKFKSREIVVKNPFTEEGLNQLEDGFKAFKEEFYSKGIQEAYLLESDLELRGELLGKIEANKSELDDYWSDIAMMANSRTDSAKKVLEELKAKAVVLEETLEDLTNELKTQEERMMDESFEYYNIATGSEYNNFEHNMKIMRKHSEKELEQVNMDEKINWVKNISEEAKANLDVKEAKVKEDIAKEAKESLLAIAKQKVSNLIMGALGDVEIEEIPEVEVDNLEAVEENNEETVVVETTAVAEEVEPTESTEPTEPVEPKVQTETAIEEIEDFSEVTPEDLSDTEDITKENVEPEVKPVNVLEENTYKSVFDEEYKKIKSVFDKLKKNVPKAAVPFFVGAASFREQMSGAFVHFKSELLIPMRIEENKRRMENKERLMNALNLEALEANKKLSTGSGVNLDDNKENTLEKLGLIEAVTDETEPKKGISGWLENARNGFYSLFDRNKKPTQENVEDKESIEEFDDIAEPVVIEDEEPVNVESTVDEEAVIEETKVESIESNDKDKTEKDIDEEAKIIIENGTKLYEYTSFGKIVIEDDYGNWSTESRADEIYTAKLVKKDKETAEEIKVEERACLDDQIRRIIVNLGEGESNEKLEEELQNLKGRPLRYTTYEVVDGKNITSGGSGMGVLNGIYVQGDVIGEFKAAKLTQEEETILGQAN